MFMDRLENRRLFAMIVGTQLQVTGGAGNDNILVRQEDASTIRVEQNGVVQLFADGAVNSILINGNGGNDSLRILSLPGLPLTEPATINGGDGNDNLLGGDGNDALNGGVGNDVLNGFGGNDALDGGTGDNNLVGGTGNDAMTAGTGKDKFDGSAGVDNVNYSGRTSALTITMDGVANDGQLVILPLPIHFENDNVLETVENVFCGSGSDAVTAGVGVVVNSFFGGAGNDRLNGRAGNDLLDCGAGDDTGIGGAGNDQLLGRAGNDVLLGGSGGDNLVGDVGNDILDGGLGPDLYSGGDGNDVLLAADGTNDIVLNAGAGFDIVDKDPGDPAPIGAEVII